MKAGPEIRRLVSADRTQFFNLVCAALLEEPNPDQPSDETAQDDFRALNSQLDHHLAGDKNFYFAVAVDGGKVVGGVAIAASFLARPGVWEIGWQVVRDDHRRQGIGTALIDHVENFALRQGAELVLLSSGQPSHHQRAGYTVVMTSDSETVMARKIR